MNNMTAIFGWLGIFATTAGASVMHPAFGLFVLGLWSLGMAWAAMKAKADNEKTEKEGK